MCNIKIVLCPTDFSPVSERGLFLATQACELLGARLVVQHNLDTFPLLYMANPEVLPESETRLLEEQGLEAQAMLKELLAQLPKQLPVETRVTTGKAPVSILELARELPADLIVMGTHGRGGLGHMLVGSTTEHVMLQSPCPVLTVRNPENTRFLDITAGVTPQSHQPILVPVDLSPDSRAHLNYACTLLDVFPGRLQVLHVLEPTSWDDMKGATHFNVPEYRHHRVQEAQEQLRAFLPPEFAERIDVHVRMGVIVDEVISHAEAIGASLIVIGARKKGLLDELFGRTSYGILKSSSCPVLVVPQQIGAGSPAHEKAAHGLAR